MHPPQRTYALEAAWAAPHTRAPRNCPATAPPAALLRPQADETHQAHAAKTARPTLRRRVATGLRPQPRAPRLPRAPANETQHSLCTAACALPPHPSDARARGARGAHQLKEVARRGGQVAGAAVLQLAVSRSPSLRARANCCSAGAPCAARATHPRRAPGAGPAEQRCCPAGMVGARRRRQWAGLQAGACRVTPMADACGCAANSFCLEHAAPPEQGRTA